MKHVMYGEKSLLIDDDAADTLIDYAAALAESGGANTVRLQAVGDDGNEVQVTFLLNAATVLIAESASADLNVPRNDEAVTLMRHEIDQIRNPPPAQTQKPGDVPDYDFDELR